METAAALSHARARPTRKLIETILGNQNDRHSAYQDFQKFLDKGGKIGLQHDPLLYGAYNLNPFLVRVEEVPMLVVEQGQVAVIKAYVGLPTQDTSGAEFKFGSLVRPGHRGIWQEPLRTGKYPINPRCYQAEIVPTFIITLNWAEVVSQAHNLDAQLKQIEAKSSEGFPFAIDLQVQIHIPDTQAPYVISMVGSVPNLVNEVLQAAVGNHFRNKLQSMPAVRVHRQPRGGAAGRVRLREGGTGEVPGGDARRVYSGGGAAAATGGGADAARNRQPGNRDLQDAEVGAGPAHGDGEGQGHGGHAGGPGQVAGGRGHPEQPDRGAQDGSRRARRPTSSRPARRRARRCGRWDWRGRRPTNGRWPPGGHRHRAGECRGGAVEEQRAVHAEHAGDGRRRWTSGTLDGLMALLMRQVDAGLTKKAAAEKD